MFSKIIGKYKFNLPQFYVFLVTFIYIILWFSMMVYATETGAGSGSKDMWTEGARIMKDIYTQLAGISTVLAGLMSVVAVIGAKMSNNQQKVDQAWDWLKRIWIAWVIINGIGAFITYFVPLFKGLDFIEI